MNYLHRVIEFAQTDTGAELLRLLANFIIEVLKALL